jgi:hypothetical protein
MTCIAGLTSGGHVYLGGDSAGVSGLDLDVRADAKVFKNGPFLFGFTTSFRMGQLLRFKFKPPAHEEGLDTYEYMVTRFVDAVRECLKEGGYARKKDEEERGGTFLVGYRGRLFYVAGDYQVGEEACGFHAVGCGDRIALGSLYSTQGHPPRARVRLALEAAERFSAGVRGPFVVLTSSEEWPEEEATPAPTTPTGEDSQEGGDE